jgi:hypothetical protein
MSMLPDIPLDHTVPTLSSKAAKHALFISNIENPMPGVRTKLISIAAQGWSDRKSRQIRIDVAIMILLSLASNIGNDYDN